MNAAEKCGERNPFWPGLVCDLEQGHSGVHIQFAGNATIGFGASRDVNVSVQSPARAVVVPPPSGEAKP